MHIQCPAEPSACAAYERSSQCAYQPSTLQTGSSCLYKDQLAYMRTYIATFVITSLIANFLFLVFAAAASGNAGQAIRPVGLLFLAGIDLACILTLLGVGVSCHKKGKIFLANAIGLIPVFLLPAFILWIWSLLFI